MRTSTLLLALPALSSAQQQFPFVDQIKGWFAQASASISSAIPSPQSVSIPDPIASGAKKVASRKVERITLDNHEQVLKPGAATATPGIEEWMVYVTGGNKTCMGTCGRSDTAWDESVVLMSASPSAPNFGKIDCEVEGVLCSAWMIGAPQILHLFIPQPLADQSQPSTTMRFITFNRTSVTAPQLAAIHLQEKYKDTEPYDGFFHPFNGPLAKFGVLIPFGWALHGFTKIPSWAFMIGVSMLSRTMM